MIFFSEAVKLWCAMAPYLLVGFLVAGFLRLFMDDDFVIRHLGRDRIVDVFKSALIGVPLPVCSCGVIPLAASLRKSGASISSTLAFLVSTPTSGVDSILATWSMLGPVFAVFRPMIALVSGMLIGMLSTLFRIKEPVKDVQAPCCHCSGNDCHSESNETEHDHGHDNGECSHCTGKGKGFRSVLEYAFVELPADIGKWLAAGVLIGALITAFFPFDAHKLFSMYPFMDFGIILVLAIPLYVCATASIPIAYSLMLKGFSPGAALVFLIAGPATNSVTLTFIYKSLGKKALVIFIGGIAITAFASGALINHLLPSFTAVKALHHHNGKALFWIQAISGIIMLLLMVFPIIRNRIRRTA